jgi:hypothetical protein
MYGHFASSVDSDSYSDSDSYEDSDVSPIKVKYVHKTRDTPEAVILSGIADAIEDFDIYEPRTIELVKFEPTQLPTLFRLCITQVTPPPFLG